MAERTQQPPGITQGDIGPRYIRKRLSDEVYIGHYIKAGDRIRIRSTIATGVIASLTTVNLTIGGRVQGMDGDLVQFGDSFTFIADGAQTAKYVMAPEGYVVDLIAESTSTGLGATDFVVVVDIVQGDTVPVAVGLLAYGYVWPAGLLGLNVQRNIAGGSGGGGMAIGGAVTSGTDGSVLYVDSAIKLAQDNANFRWKPTANQKRLLIGGDISSDFASWEGPPKVAAVLAVDGDYTALLSEGAALFIDSYAHGGTQAAPVAITVDSTLFSIDVNAFGGGATSAIASVASLTVRSDPALTISASVVPGAMSLSTADALGSLKERLRISAVGSTGIAALSANTSVGIAGQLEVQNSVILHKGVTFANLPATPVAGMVAYVTDSNAFVWGATIAGGSTHKVLGFYNGTNWTVAGA